MIMQVIWLVFIYFLTGTIVNFQPQQLPSRKRGRRPSYSKSLSLSFILGLGGVMIADWLSDGDPLWPALGLISGVVGALFPIGSSAGQNFLKGLAVYLGGVFYLKPLLALVGLSIALEGLLWSKDLILTVLLFSSILPVLFNFSQVNPLFLQAAIVIQLLFLIIFKDEIRLKFRGLSKSQKIEGEMDKIKKP